jgi:hypothetical protein
MKAIYSDSSFDIISKSDLVDKLDWQSIIEMKDELKENFQKVQTFRTPTEMRISVLNDLKHPTPSSKYRQSVREMNVMFTELIELSYDYRKTNLEKKQLENSMSKEEDEIKKELMKIEIERTDFHLRQMEKTGIARIDEIKEWSLLKSEFAQNMTEEELICVDNHQLLSYTGRFINQAIANKDNSNMS